MDKTKIRTGGSLSWEEREAMVKEYLSGQYTKVEIWKKYTGQNEEHGQLLRWMRDLGYVSERMPNERSQKFLTLRRQAPQILENLNDDTNPVDLQKRIKELEKQLEVTRLKAEGYEIMIKIAEKELKIPIRKKSDTK